MIGEAAPAAIVPASRPGRPSSWKEGLRGVWLLVVQLVLYDLVFRISRKLSESVKDYPGADPPWYFIRRDAIQGACSLVALAICLALAWATWRRNRTYAPMVAAFSLISFGGRAWQFLVISAFTRHLRQPDRMTTRWPTFHSYLGDRLVVAGALGAFVLATGVIVLGSWRARRAASTPRNAESRG